MENQIKIALQNNKLLKNILFEDIDLSNIKGNLLTVSEGQILFRESDESDKIYLIVSGEVNVLHKKSGSKAVSLIFTDNDFFGCDEFIENKKRKSTAVALRDSYIITLSKPEVDNLIEQNFEILNNIYANIQKEELEIGEEAPEAGDQVPETPLPAEELFSSDSAEPKAEIHSDEQPAEDLESFYSSLEEPGASNESEIIPSESSVQGDDDLDSFYASLESQSDSNISLNSKTEDISGLDEYEKSYNFSNDSSKETTEANNLAEDPGSTIPYDELPDEISSESPEPDSVASDIFDDEKPVEQEKAEVEEKVIPEPKPEEKVKIKADKFTEEVKKDMSKCAETVEFLEKINKAATLVNTNIQIDDVLKNIVNVACELTEADRGTLYLVDKEKNELWSKVAMGNEFKEIKLQIGEGIAGWVAEKGELINLEDVQNDPRFNTSFDKSSGYVTKSMICFPVRNRNEDIVGVLQLLNSKGGKFSSLDEELLESLSIHAAMALQNAELVEQLISGERISSLGKMANFLIQDIKKPILVSKRYAEHLKAKELSEDVSKVVDMLLDQLNHIADLVQSTSAYSEGQIVIRSVVTRLNTVLDDYIHRLEAFVSSRGCSITKEYDKDVNVKISEKQFFQCFQHIVKNACDAMPEGGNITVTTKLEKNAVNIFIKDNGLGIPENLQSKIFEPFMSHGKKEGTGLGLSITKKIIEEHGGTIKVKSEVGEGATFIVTFPVAR
ncbi:MAG: GAF domain-containing protein [Melioribacteraceae bacterium]|nr:GAF domain-containing protein [Melioribacteraceae bacterium]